MCTGTSIDNTTYLTGTCLNQSGCACQSTLILNVYTLYLYKIMPFTFFIRINVCDRNNQYFAGQGRRSQTITNVIGIYI